MLLDSLVDLTEAEDTPAIGRNILAFCKDRGFAACFFIAPIARNTFQGRELFSMGYPKSWASAYRRCLYRIDPLPEIALSSRRPYRWSEAAHLRSLSPLERRYLGMLERTGFGDGIVFPLISGGMHSAIAGFGRHPDLDSLGKTDLIEIQLYLHSVSENYSRIANSEFHSENELSGREKDVLYWLTQGKSNNAIATILDISSSTVDTYVRRIFRKLAVTDRVGAAMAAVQYGYVIPVKYRKDSQLDAIASAEPEVVP